MKITSLTSPVHRGSEVTLTASTLAGASCDIHVAGPAGASSQADLVPKVADSLGLVSWTWQVGAHVQPGTYPVTVSCRLGGQSASATRDLVVVA